MKKHANSFITLLSVMMIFVLVISFSIVLTNSKYVIETPPTDDNSGELEYTVADQIEVTSVEAFFSAVKNGYSNIKVAESVQNPFIVSGGQMDVTSDLILDLNGHDLQRNDRTPMLSIGDGVKMIVIDTSNKRNGSFYNPVGSVFDINGGTLTVLSGQFESGVRDNEYSTSADTESLGQIKGEKTVTFYKKSGDNRSYTQMEGVNVPVIEPHVTTVNGFPYTNGNIYYAQANQDGVNASGQYTDILGNHVSLPTEYDFIHQDTYLYYTDNRSSQYAMAPTAGSADFYYEYTAKDEHDEDLKVIIYGFYDVMATAEDSSTHYAAIQMRKGKLQVRGGQYYSHFGVDTSYCVYASGGIMTIHEGEFEASRQGVCVSCSYTQMIEDDVEGSLSVFDGQFKSYGGDTIQMNAGEMFVYGGLFIKDASGYSEHGGDYPHNYHLDGEDMSVIGQRARQALDWGKNNSIINIEGGRLSITGTDDHADAIRFLLKGCNMCGVKASEGSDIVLDYSMFYFCRNEEDINAVTTFTPYFTSLETTECNNIGVFNAGGDITLSNTVFIMPGDYSTGVVSTASNVSRSSGAGLIDVKKSVFSLGGRYSAGIDAAHGEVRLGENLRGQAVDNHDGDHDQSEYVLFYVEHVKDCFGVYVSTNECVLNEDRTTVKDSDGNHILHETGQNVKVTVNAAQIYMGQYFYDASIYGEDNSAPAYYRNGGVDFNHQLFNSVGIYMNAINGAVQIERAAIYTAGDFTAGVLVRQGKIYQVSHYNFAIVAGAYVDHLDYGGVHNNIANKGHSVNSAGHYKTFFGTNWYCAQYGPRTYVVDANLDIQSGDDAEAVGCYGIVSLDGAIKANNLYVRLHSTYGSAIYSQGGLVDLTGCARNLEDFDPALKLDDDDDDHTGSFQCDVRTARNPNREAPMCITGPGGCYTDGNGVRHHVNHGENTRTSCVVRLARAAGATTGGTLKIRESSVKTDSYGYFLEGGDLFFGSNHMGTSDSEDTENHNQIVSTNGAAIGIYGGELLIYPGDSLHVDATIDTSKSVESGGYGEGSNTSHPTNFKSNKMKIAAIFLCATGTEGDDDFNDAFFTSWGTVVVNANIRSAVNYGDTADTQIISGISVERGRFNNFGRLEINCATDTTQATTQGTKVAVSAVYVGSGVFKNSTGFDALATATPERQEKINAVRTNPELVNHILREEDIYCHVHANLIENRNSDNPDDIFPAAILIQDGSLYSYADFLICGGVTRNGYTLTTEDFDPNNPQPFTGGFVNDDSYFVNSPGYRTNVVDNLSVRDFEARMFALRIRSEIIEPTVQIAKLHIVTNVGGGVKIEGGNTVFGSEDADNEDIVIATLGTEYDTRESSTGIKTKNDNWMWYYNRTGGSCVSVRGGTTKIYNGIFTALHGDGLVARGGVTTVYNGYFDGYNRATEAACGSSYGLKILGGELYVHNGSFGTGETTAAGANKNPYIALNAASGHRNCLIIIGTDNDNRAVGHIYGGRFETASNAAICAYGFAELYLGNSANPNDKGLNVVGGNAVLTMEHLATENNPLWVIIYSGSYTRSSTKQGAWNGVLYSDNSNAELTLYGGDYYVTNNAVIRIVGTCKPVHIYGGTFHIASPGTTGGRFVGLQQNDGSGEKGLKTGASLPYTNGSDFDATYIILGASTSDNTYECASLGTIDGYTVYTFRAKS